MTTTTTGLPMLGHLQADVQARDTWAEIRGAIEHGIDEIPRTLQTRIGPSEVGTTCDACLVLKLAGVPEPRDTAWLPFVGQSVHEQLSVLLADYNDGHDLRWLVESAVSVGEIGGVDITGHADLFDLETGTVTDYKIVGVTTLRKVKSKGPTPTYRIQGHLYGRGFVRRGLKVTTVQIAFLPRNSPNLGDAIVWSEPYDEQVALDALERADRFAQALAVYGLDAVLAVMTSGHNGEEYSCSRYDASILPPGHRAPEAFTDILG